MIGYKRADGLTDYRVGRPDVTVDQAHQMLVWAIDIINRSSAMDRAMDHARDGDLSAMYRLIPATLGAAEQYDSDDEDDVVVYMWSSGDGRQYRMWPVEITENGFYCRCGCEITK